MPEVVPHPLHSLHKKLLFACNHLIWENLRNAFLCISLDLAQSSQRKKYREVCLDVCVALHSLLFEKQGLLLAAGLVWSFAVCEKFDSQIATLSSVEWSLKPVWWLRVTADSYLHFAGRALRFVNFRPCSLSNFFCFLTSLPVCACSWQTGWVTFTCCINTSCSTAQ